MFAVWCVIDCLYTTWLFVFTLGTLFGRIRIDYFYALFRARANTDWMYGTALVWVQCCFTIILLRMWCRKHFVFYYEVTVCIIRCYCWADIDAWTLPSLCNTLRWNFTREVVWHPLYYFLAFCCGVQRIWSTIIS